MKIIEIEGLDGSGKSTHADLLKTNIELRGYKAMFVHLPYYESETGEKIAAYLRGDLKLSLWESRILFLENRYEFFENNKEKLKLFDYVIFDRYSLSNPVYHVAKMLIENNEVELKKIIREGEIFENEVFEILLKYFKNLESEKKVLQPDFSIILDVSIEDLKLRFEERNKTKRDYLQNKSDINESNFKLLDKCKYLYSLVPNYLSNVKIIKVNNTDKKSKISKLLIEELEKNKII